MKGLIAGIYESKEIGNCSNSGISKKCKKVTIVGKNIPEIFESDKNAPEVKIVTRTIGGQIYLHAEPIQKNEANEWLAGGSFIYSCDSRFPSRYPIALHDRQEIQLNEEATK